MAVLQATCNEKETQAKSPTNTVSVVLEVVSKWWWVCAESLQSCPILCDPMDYSLPGSSIHRQEYWSGLPYPPPGDLPNPGIELGSLTSPALAGRFFTTQATWEALSNGKWWLTVSLEIEKVTMQNIYMVWLFLVWISLWLQLSTRVVSYPQGSRGHLCSDSLAVTVWWARGRKAARPEAHELLLLKGGLLSYWLSNVTLKIDVRKKIRLWCFEPRIELRYKK